MDLRVFFYRKFVVGQGTERSIAREFLEKMKKSKKKHLLCYRENVGASIARPCPRAMCKAFPEKPCCTRLAGEQCSPLQSFITAE